MRSFRLDLWKPEEYDYKAAYGFMPNIRAYLHEEDDQPRKCMLMVPGGGYCMLAPHEGELPAMEYYKMGLNVFVLTYTNDITMCVPLKKQPVNDISRAVRLIRKNADEYRIIPDNLLICGFSAGGHVCGSLCVHFNDIADPDPVLNAVSNRPDAAILAYPVITSGKYTHIYSMQALLGYDPSPGELEYFSLEKQVTADTPPCFLWQTAEDNAVPVENTYLFAMALREAGVPFAHYVFPSGMHGLSVASPEQFSGRAGGEYVCEQLGLALKHVKDNTAVNLSSRRREELMKQFSMTEDPEPAAGDATQSENTGNDQPGSAPDGEHSVSDADIERGRLFSEHFADVQMWPRLSQIWFERIFSKKSN